MQLFFSHDAVRISISANAASDGEGRELNFPVSDLLVAFASLVLTVDVLLLVFAECCCLFVAKGRKEK